jgi:hypothetical protein
MAWSLLGGAAQAKGASAFDSANCLPSFARKLEFGKKLTPLDPQKKKPRCENSGAGASQFKNYGLSILSMTSPRKLFDPITAPLGSSSEESL